MRISEIHTTPLWIPYTQPYHFAQGVILGAGVILVEVRTDDGVTGYGESIATPSAEGIQAYLARAAEICIGRSPFENARLMGEAYHALFELEGTCSAPRFAGQVLAGLEMALWDAMGKAVGRPVHALLGGAVRDEVRYFGFPQGETAQQVAEEAGLLADAGHEVIYVKVGRGDALDTAVVAEVRAAIGPDKRLRVDPNERWQPARAIRMIRKLSRYDIELVEQPTHAESIDALARVRAGSPVAIAADQSVYTPAGRLRRLPPAGGRSHRHRPARDRRTVAPLQGGACRRGGGHRCLYPRPLRDRHHHGGVESGGGGHPQPRRRQPVHEPLLAWDIVGHPDLTPRQGKLPILDGPGLGFTLDQVAVARAAQAWGDRS